MGSLVVHPPAAFLWEEVGGSLLRTGILPSQKPGWRLLVGQNEAVGGLSFAFSFSFLSLSCVHLFSSPFFPLLPNPSLSYPPPVSLFLHHVPDTSESICHQVLNTWNPARGLVFLIDDSMCPGTWFSEVKVLPESLQKLSDFVCDHQLGVGWYISGR